MGDTVHKIDTEFESQLRGLVDQAEKELGSQLDSLPPAEAALEAKPAPAAGSASASLPSLLRPLLVAMEALSRVSGENTALLRKLAQDGPAGGGDLPGVVAELRGILEMKNGVTQGMFSALHEELRGYKDAFLLEAVHRPMIRDLISLYDDLVGIHRQVHELGGGDAAAKGAGVGPLLKRAATIATNLAHNLEFILEVLARLEVVPLPERTGPLDKATQRAVVIEKAATEAEDGHVVRSLKRGFLWKDRVVRAEEVVIKKWRVTAPEPEPEAPL